MSFRKPTREGSHANARTTPRIRWEIQVVPPSVSNAALARRYGIHRHTVAKWRKRASTEDASARPHRLCTTLTEAQEQVVVAIRELLLLPLDDLLVVVREFIEPCLSRSALDRCLRRHGVSDLRTLQRERDGDKDSLQPLKRFKAYEPGFVHIDVKYLPKMQDEASRKYLFVAIDRTTRWVYLEIRKDKRAKSAQAFKRVFDIVKDFGISESPKSTRSSTTHWRPGRPGHRAFRHNIASSLRLHTGFPYDWTPRSDAPLGSPLAPSARRVSRVASRLPGTTRLRFALHGGQRMTCG